MADETTQIQEKSVMEKAEEIAKRIEEANKRSEELVKKQEELYSRAILSGKSFAGSTPVVVDKEKEEKDRINNWLKPFGRTI